MWGESYILNAPKVWKINIKTCPAQDALAIRVDERTGRARNILTGSFDAPDGSLYLLTRRQVRMPDGTWRDTE